MLASPSGARSPRSWWVAVVVVFAVAAFQVATALHGLRSGADEDIRPSFVVWSGVPALFALAVLLIAKRGRVHASFTMTCLCAVALVTALVYLWGYWLGYEAADPGFLFIFAPLFQSGAYLVGGGFGLILAAILKQTRKHETL